jgi:hypothetical protein
MNNLNRKKLLKRDWVSLLNNAKAGSLGVNQTSLKGESLIQNKRRNYKQGIKQPSENQNFIDVVNKKGISIINETAGEESSSKITGDVLERFAGDIESTKENRSYETIVTPRNTNITQKAQVKVKADNGSIRNAEERIKENIAREILG